MKPIWKKRMLCFAMLIRNRNILSNSVLWVFNNLNSGSICNHWFEPFGLFNKISYLAQCRYRFGEFFLFLNFH